MSTYKVNQLNSHLFGVLQRCRLRVHHFSKWVVCNPAHISGAAFLVESGWNCDHIQNHVSERFEGKIPNGTRR